MKTKSFIVPTIYLLLIFSVSIGLYFTKEAYTTYTDKDNNEEINYVSGVIFSRTIPIINIDDVLMGPYDNQEVTIGRYFYNADDALEQQQKSLVFYNDTYMPNTGIDYVLSKEFDVLSIYDGTVIDVKEDELLGKTVEIRHNNEIISVYQGLGNIEVKKGDIVVSGFKIGTSGTSKLNAALGNHVHLEIYKNGEVLDPLKCFGKKLGDI